MHVKIRQGIAHPFIPGQECPLFQKRILFSKIEWMFPPWHSISLTFEKEAKICQKMMLKIDTRPPGLF